VLLVWATILMMDDRRSETVPGSAGHVAGRHESESMNTGGGPGGAAEWIPEMVDRLVRQFRPLRVILFGSQARGDAHPDSDVDLLVVLSHVEDKHASMVAMLGALRDLPVSKDVVVTTPEDIARRGHLAGTVLRPALREGKVLYERA
jgi:uncharacterized protein